MDFITTAMMLALSLAAIQPMTAISPALLLTPYIQQNKTLEARRHSIVNPSLFLNRTSHSGFLTVDPRYNSSTFFWYFPVEEKAVNDTPLILWLQGGPGVSSLAGVFDEIGPFEYVNGELRGRKYAWTNDHSVLFLDNPIGAGYSFTDSELGYARNMTTYANHLLSALQQFLTIFPELRKAPLFIAGESYAGRYVPALALRILEEGKLTDEWMINLQGLIMGNPVMNRDDVGNFSDVYYQWGLVDSLGVLAAKPLQDQYWQAMKQGNSQLAFQLRQQLLKKLEDISMQQDSYNALVDEYPLHGFEQYLSLEAVGEALHVGQIRFSFDNDTVKNMLVQDFLTNVQPMMEKLLEKYKVLIYCGQLDLTSPCVPNAEARRSKWHWSRREEFLNAPRPPWWQNETVAGYVKSGGNLMEALVRGAGHLVPIDKPAEALKLVSSFIKEVDVELPPNYSYNPSNDTQILPYHTDDIVYVTPSTEKSKNETKAKEPTVTPEVSKSKSDNSEHNGDKTGNIPTNTPIVIKELDSDSGVSAGTIVSIILNVILVLIVMCGSFFYYRLKRKSEDFFYNNVENNSDDLFLT